MTHFLSKNSFDNYFWYCPIFTLFSIVFFHDAANLTLERYRWKKFLKTFNENCCKIWFLNTLFLPRNNTCKIFNNSRFQKDFIILTSFANTDAYIYAHVFLLRLWTMKVVITCNNIHSFIEISTVWLISRTELLVNQDYFTLQQLMSRLLIYHRNFLPNVLISLA